MTRVKGTLALTAAMATAIALSGCFGWAGLQFSKLKLAPGPAKKSKTVATISTIPVLTEQQKEDLNFPRRDYPFVIVDVPEGLKLLGGGRRFDVKGKFGPKGGRKLIRDDDLRDELFAQGFCGDATDSPTNYTLLRTEDRVNDRGATGTRVISKLSFRQVARATQYGPGIDVFSGNWIDDGDGVPDGDDLVGCTGGGYHNLALKAQANIPIRAAKRDLRERAGG